ncbi:hypothetical protein [Paenirhodobacter sp.]|uniref:hypothetical protein n=1 Tax=Paenirhodobacter sp. TaxID=1965326 RepID=UPI003B420901
MTPISTEFPVKPRAAYGAFVAEVIAWLRGTTYSTVLSEATDQELSGEYAHLTTASGEALRIRVLTEGDDWQAVGFRHDVRDQSGFEWRTEAVLRRKAVAGGEDLLRVRAQCIAAPDGKPLPTAKKPYLVKALLNAGWGGTDGVLEVSNAPHRLEADDDGLALAAAIVKGDASETLPIIYISSCDNSRHAFSENSMKTLAYELGGIAHVVIEPNRGFSFDLRDRIDGENVYGGGIGIALPKRGFTHRRYFKSQNPK